MDAVKVDSKVEITTDFDGRKGVIIAVCKNGNIKEYIIQFKKPTRWDLFQRKEFKVIK